MKASGKYVGKLITIRMNILVEYDKRTNSFHFKISPNLITVSIIFTLILNRISMPKNLLVMRLQKRNSLILT